MSAANIINNIKGLFAVSLYIGAFSINHAKICSRHFKIRANASDRVYRAASTDGALECRASQFIKCALCMPNKLDLSMKHLRTFANSAAMRRNKCATIFRQHV